MCEGLRAYGRMDVWMYGCMGVWLDESGVVWYHRYGTNMILTLLMTHPDHDNR